MCHDGTVTAHFADWAGTKHTIAYDSLVFIQNDVNCLPCHTTGWNPDIAGGGFDDYFTIADQAGIDKMKNVQCESCHTRQIPKPLITLAADNCGASHEGDHHPTYSE